MKIAWSKGISECSDYWSYLVNIRDILTIKGVLLSCFAMQLLYSTLHNSWYKAIHNWLFRNTEIVLAYCTSIGSLDCDTTCDQLIGP